LTVASMLHSVSVLTPAVALIQSDWKRYGAARAMRI